MGAVQVFKPRRSRGWLWMVVLALAFIGIGVLTALPIVSAASGDTIALVVVLANGLVMLAIGVPFLVLAAWFPTMRYELDDRALTLYYGPVLKYCIPLEKVQVIRRRNLSISLWSSMRFPGLALFTVLYADVGKVKMCATAAATGILLIETETEKYGLTPAEEEKLVAALQARMRV